MNKKDLRITSAKIFMLMVLGLSLMFSGCTGMKMARAPEQQYEEVNIIFPNFLGSYNIFVTPDEKDYVAQVRSILETAERGMLFQAASEMETLAEKFQFNKTHSDFPMTLLITASEFYLADGKIADFKRVVNTISDLRSSGMFLRPETEKRFRSLAEFEKKLYKL